MEKILEVKDLKKVFKKKDGSEHIAVNGISFHLVKGEIFSFLGPNGAGKSTTINMLTTQMEPTGGTITLHKQPISEEPTFARGRIGIVAQHNNLDRGLTAKENLVYHGKYFGMTHSEAEQKASELLKSFGLSNWQNEFVKSFSGGMAQRLKIARAIMHEPEILFLDEPTTGLDPAYREILWEHVLHLNKKKGTTVFLTTHYMEEPERFSDRVAVYNQGEIKAIGTVDELRKLIPSSDVINITVDSLASINIMNVMEMNGVKDVTLKDEKTFIVYTENSKEVLSKLLGWLDEQNASIENINLSSATLEDIFIHLTNQKTKGVN
ncbi:ABC transporter ATP-binding protein [Metaclostridioides mangenotii]|uniref:ABC transporter ATP-binding protein n=1 Tax=Metaclostridioides mangenotii TaxID=1540 RepID=UPI0026ED01FA|nr:ATP-binding cassette domain-containing protein [Clostridioides mangenotii]